MPPTRQISSKSCANFMSPSIPAPTLPVASGTSVNAFQSNALVKAEVSMRMSKTLGTILAIAACGASAAALADNPVGFYVGAGIGDSQIRSDDSYYGYPGYYNDNQFAWQGIIGIRPIRILGLEATYIDFGTPYRHNGITTTTSPAAILIPRPPRCSQWATCRCPCRSSTFSPRPARPAFPPTSPTSFNSPVPPVGPVLTSCRPIGIKSSIRDSRTVRECNPSSRLD